MGVAAIAGAIGLYDYKKREKESEQRHKNNSATSARNAQVQSNIATDERTRRLKLLQGGTSNAFENATGRKSLLGQ